MGGDDGHTIQVIASCSGDVRATSSGWWWFCDSCGLMSCFVEPRGLSMLALPRSASMREFGARVIVGTGVLCCADRRFIRSAPVCDSRAHKLTPPLGMRNEPGELGF